MNEDSVLLEAAMGEKVGTFIFSISMFATGLAVAFAYGWDLTLVMLTVMPLLAGSVALLFKASPPRLDSSFNNSHSPSPPLSSALQVDHVSSSQWRPRGLGRSLI